jgi:SAM-dependent methyltransferase
MLLSLLKSALRGARKAPAVPAQGGAPLRLNLGSGQNPVVGYLNVDRYGTPDQHWDLEKFPWPWADDSVEEVLLTHVLEHLGGDPAVFICVMQQLYRVCRHDARVRIRVPHPRHDHFLTDPTHVRPILPATFTLFSRRLNQEWARAGNANSPLALYHGVDFEVEKYSLVLDEPWRSQLAAGTLSESDAEALVARHNNVASELAIVLRVVKDRG